MRRDSGADREPAVQHGADHFGTMGDIRVYVSATDEARAQELLRNATPNTTRLDDDDETLVTDEGEAAIDESARRGVRTGMSDVPPPDEPPVPREQRIDAASRATTPATRWRRTARPSRGRRRAAGDAALGADRHRSGAHHHRRAGRLHRHAIPQTTRSRAAPSGSTPRRAAPAAARPASRPRRVTDLPRRERRQRAGRHETVTGRARATSAAAARRVVTAAAPEGAARHADQRRPRRRR